MSRLGSAEGEGFPTSRAGMPTATRFGGISRRTTDPAPIFELAPTVMGPRMVTPAPITTPSPIFGWRSPSLVPVPPSVTPCRMDTLFPTTAVSPMTTPVAWSNITPSPITAPGWMSTWNTSEMRLCSSSASGSLFSFHSACATLCACTAWKPLKKSRICRYLSHAGSRSTTACRSACALRTSVASFRYCALNSSRSCESSNTLLRSLFASTNASASSSERCARMVENK
mmetsp:Transcript_15283/g.64486  ORF Transcript_15283/g.64486 Transcript_15283/m.64486 type:complete len:228 (+) Transcript_15283:215-898(+)